MSSELLPCERIEPDGEARAAVVWMHGLGADGHDFVPIVPELRLPASLGVRFVFPHAPRIPVTVNMGMVMPAWFDVVGLDFRRQPDLAGVERSADAIAALVERERRAGIPSERVCLAGFSQGGAMALHAGLRHPERLAGLVALSSFFATAEDAQDRSAHAPANAALPVFQAHGALDPMVPIERGRAAYDRLVELGHDVEWHEYPMQHQVCLEEIRALGAWLARVLG